MFLILLRMLLLLPAAEGFSVSLSHSRVLWRSGDNQQLVCRVSDCPHGSEFMWTSLQDKPLYAEARSNQSVSVLPFRPVLPQHENVIVCKVKCGQEAMRAQHSRVSVYSFPKEPIILGSEHLVAGKMCTLTCVVPEVYPPESVEIFWLLGGAIIKQDMGSGPIQANISSDYTFFPLPGNTGRKLTCRAQLMLEVSENVKETTVTMNVMYPPTNTTIHLSPSGTVKEGDSITITCSTESVPPALVLLHRLLDSQESEIISSNLSITSHTLHSAQMAQSGQYQCQATNQHGSQKARVNVTVSAYPLEVELGPGDGVLAVPRASILLLTCRASGCPDPTFFWKSSLDGPVYSQVETENSLSMLHLSPVDLLDDKAYTCEVHCGSVRKSKHKGIKVYAFPTTPVIWSSNPLVEGSMSLLHCGVNGVFPSSLLLIQWLGEGGELLHENSPFSDGQENLTSTLPLEPKPQDQGRRIICKASLQIEGVPEEQISKQTVMTLEPEYPPRNTAIQLSPSGTVKEGDSVTITCSTDSVPPALVLLHRLSDSQESEIISSNLSITSHTLHSAQMAQSGQYQCQATNQHGSQKARLAVTVSAPPKITSVELLPSGQVLEGQGITVSCRTIGFPPPEVVLKKLDDDSQEIYSDNGTFHLLNLMPSDSGTYQINVTNDLGHTTETFTISVIEKRTSPPPSWSMYVIPSVALITLVGASSLIVHHVNMARRKGSYELAKSAPPAV